MQERSADASLRLVRTKHRAVVRIHLRLATYWTCCGSQTRAPGARVCDPQQAWLLVWSEIISGNRYSELLVAGAFLQ